VRRIALNGMVDKKQMKAGQIMKLLSEADKAKEMLRAKGWSNRRACQFLGISLNHISCVLNGHRQSRRLLIQISKMPISSEPYKNLGFGRRK
jgi:hypothetical protein